MINPATKRKMISSAILEAVNAGNGGWIKGIFPAVEKALGKMTVNAMVVRGQLQELMNKGSVCRAAFDPFADDEYYVTPNTPGAR